MKTPAIYGRFPGGRERCGSQILNFPDSPRKNCIACGVPFNPILQWHELCRQCWTFNRIGLACTRFNEWRRI